MAKEIIDVDDLSESINEILIEKTLEMISSGIAVSKLTNLTQLMLIKSTDPENDWVGDLVRIILNEFKAVKVGYKMFAIANPETDVLVSFKKDYEISQKYGARLGISFKDERNAENLAILFHGGQLKGEVVTEEGKESKVMVDAKKSFDVGLANKIGAVLSEKFRKRLSVEPVISEIQKKIDKINKKLKDEAEELAAKKKKEAEALSKKGKK